MMKITRSTIPKVCLWAGMGSRFLTGCINYMVLDKSLSARFAVELVTGDEELLKSTFKSGAMPTE